jgi:nucleotide-binding universal stress UspA family protein
MYRHILIPVDGTHTADKAVVAGIEFARQAGAKVTLFTAVPEYQLPSEADLMSRRRVVSLWDHERISRDNARAILDPAAERLRAAGVECDTAYSECDRPFEAIVAAAQTRGCDLILMASHGRTGFAGLWHGSQTREVIAHSTLPTLVYH